MEECLCNRRVGHEMKEDLIFLINELRASIISSARVTYKDIEARVISHLRYKEMPPPVLPGPIEERDIKAPHTFLPLQHDASRPQREMGSQCGTSRTYSQGHDKAFVAIGSDAISSTIPCR
jgi:hypothetical protein